MVNLANFIEFPKNYFNHLLVHTANKYFNKFHEFVFWVILNMPYIKI